MKRLMVRQVLCGVCDDLGKGILALVSDNLHNSLTRLHHS